METDTKVSDRGIAEGYSAPEQYHERGKKGAHTDIYAICAVLYWMITGIVPQDAFDRIFDDQVKHLLQAGAAVSEKQDAVLMKGLSIRPKDRYDGIVQLKKAYEESIKVNKKLSGHAPASQKQTAAPAAAEKKQNESDAETFYQRGLNHYLGFGVPQDYEKAIYWLRAAADVGDHRAYYQLGLCYEMTATHGDHMYARRKQAFEWFLKAALHRDARSHYKYKLAQCYESGFGTETDMTEAVKWYGEAAAMGHVKAKEMMEKLKGSAKKAKQPQPVIPTLSKKIAEKLLSPEELYQKARSLKNGAWSSEGVELLRKAAEAGHAEAQYELGFCYENGAGTVARKTLAFYWYDKAARNPDAKANYKYKLGLCYSEGLGVGKSEANALKWYESAAEMGHTWAENKVVDYYLNASPAVQKTQQARNVLEKAAKNGNIRAQMKLGEYYQTGFGVVKNESIAFDWYLRAAKLGSPQAQLYVGDAYYYGNGIAKNKQAAEEWYTKATTKGLAAAWYRLGMCYRENPGKHTAAEIRKCFEQAAALGETAAKRYL